MNFDSMDAGRTIRRIRVQQGLSQDVLSGLAGIARSHLSMIECGSKNPNFETVCKIAIALEMRPSALVALMEEDTHK